ncbi:magnesium transporter [Bowdeniella nasicola]|uniref:Magnesium transporter MgtE n=1 Tax=Bowdeniella nasicola TaxID=208480 RepID=A0A1H3VMA8_9ACTO|nr:magnesium transporter [Bowdeniella nasicola]SDZ75248.1 magnesium transporter [Bowdeniella nasicola]
MLTQLEERLIDDISSGDIAELSTLAAEASIPDLISVVEHVPAKRGAVMFRLLAKDRALEVFEALDAGHQADLLDALRDEQIASIFTDLDPDDRAALLDEVPASVADKLLRGLSRHERGMTAALLGYPKGSIGRRMSPEVVPVRETRTIGYALELLRTRSEEYETLYMIPVMDDTRRLVGVVSLRDMFTAAPDAIIADIMTSPISAQATDDAEDTARQLLAIGKIAMPIVDGENRIVGVLTVDDALEIVEAADTEDVARHGGHEPLRRPYLSTPVLNVVKSRIVWLLVLAVSAVLTVQVLEIFESTLAEVVVLALFIPLLTGTGGNTGNQAATTVTRALALGDVWSKDVLAVLWREARIGFTLGAVLGALGFGVATLVYGVAIGTVIGLTLLSVCTMAASIGGVMPIIAKAVGADPAVFSNPFISTFCDATGLVMYFVIAKAVLGI